MNEWKGTVIMSDIRKYMREKNNTSTDDDVDERQLEKRLKLHKLGKFTRVLIVVSVLVIAIFAYYIHVKNKIYKEYEVKETVEITDVYKSKFYPFGDYLLRYSDDGLAFLNGSKTYWNQAFEMKNSVIDICDEYVAVADYKTNSIYICNTESSQGSVETEYPIIGIDVSGNGVVAAITGEESDVSHIEVIGKGGTKIAKGQTVLSGQGCPVDLTISHDGTKLMVSYLHVSSGVIESKVVFYNYSEVGKNEVDRFVGGFDYDKTVMAKVDFITNDIAVAFGDDKFVVYSMKQKPSVIATIDIDYKIKSIFNNSEYIGLVVENNEAESPYTMIVYDLKGNKLSETKLNFMYKDVKIADESIVVYNDTTFKVYNVEGVLKYEGEMEEGIQSVIVKDKDYEYYVIGSLDIKDIKLK